MPLAIIGALGLSAWLAGRGINKAAMGFQLTGLWIVLAVLALALLAYIALR